MIPVLTKSEAYKIDKDTIISGCSTELELMDNAGMKIAQFFCEKISDPFNQKVLVVSGKGNNGGDGRNTKKLQGANRIVGALSGDVLDGDADIGDDKAGVVTLS